MLHECRSNRCQSIKFNALVEMGLLLQSSAVNFSALAAWLMQVVG